MAFRSRFRTSNCGVPWALGPAAPSLRSTMSTTGSSVASQCSVGRAMRCRGTVFCAWRGSASPFRGVRSLLPLPRHWLWHGAHELPALCRPPGSTAKTDCERTIGPWPLTFNAATKRFWAHFRPALAARFDARSAFRSPSSRSRTTPWYRGWRRSIARPSHAAECRRQRNRGSGS